MAVGDVKVDEEDDEVDDEVGAVVVLTGDVFVKVEGFIVDGAVADVDVVVCIVEEIEGVLCVVVPDTIDELPHNPQYFSQYCKAVF